MSEVLVFFGSVILAALIVWFSVWLEGRRQKGSRTFASPPAPRTALTERCNCGASVEIGLIDIDHGLAILKAWRSDHKCNPFRGSHRHRRVG